MASYWTSPNSKAYVNDYVYITLAFPEPIPEPDFDILMKRISETVRKYAVDEGGIRGKVYRIDEDLADEENPTVIIDGLQYVSFTGQIKIMCLCEDRQGEELREDLMWDIREYCGQVADYEANGDY